MALGKKASNRIPAIFAGKSVVVLGFSFALVPAFERRLLSPACVVVRQARPSHAQRQNQSGVLLLAACAERIQSLRSGDAASRIFALSTEIRINAVNTRCCYYHKKPCDKIKDCALCRLFATMETKWASNAMSKCEKLNFLPSASHVLLRWRNGQLAMAVSPHFSSPFLPLGGHSKRRPTLRECDDDVPSKTLQAPSRRKSIAQVSALWVRKQIAT
jgi:hypothetical protein